MNTITRADYFKLHGEPQGESRAALLENANEWVRRANLLYSEMAADGIELCNDQVSGNPIASGYRPAGVNAATSNAATGSKHLTCRAGDTQDWTDRRIAVWCIRNLVLLETYGMWMEDPRWTGGRIRPNGEKRDPWTHWQTVPPGSGNRVYIPYADVIANPPTDPDFYVRNGLAKPKYL